MEYISHTDYTKMLNNFGKETPKEVLKEGVEEGNAFTAGLAKTKKGGEFKVDGKTVKDTSGYDNSSVKEYSISDEYPESWKMREGGEAEHDRATAVAERLKAQGMDEEAVHVYLVDDMDLDGATAQAVCDSVFGAKEGLNLPSPGMKATGQTIVATEGDQMNRFSVLSPSEREQLKEYINSMKTIKQEIKKLVEKAKGGAMEEEMGGNRTGLVMTKSTMSEKEENIPAEEKPVYHEPTDRYKSDDHRMAKVLTKAEMWEDDAADDEFKLDPKLHQALHKLVADLKKSGLDAEDIKLLVKHEMEKKGQEAVMGQWDI